jgi:hypothetical protein
MRTIEIGLVCELPEDDDDQRGRAEDTDGNHNHRGDQQAPR